jgi:hypothetical protein
MRVFPFARHASERLRLCPPGNLSKIAHTPTFPRTPQLGGDADFRFARKQVEPFGDVSEATIARQTKPNSSNQHPTVIAESSPKFALPAWLQLTCATVGQRSNHGFNRRKMEDQRRGAAEREAAGRRATDAQGLETNSGPDYGPRLGGCTPGAAYTRRGNSNLRFGVRFTVQFA